MTILPPSTLDHLMEVISRMIAEMEALAVEEAGFADLSMRQVVYLQTITEIERPTFSDVADRLGVSKPSVTAIVGTLIRKGYVKKIQSEEDRRVYHIVLTKKGQDFEQLHTATHQRLAQHLVRNLTAEEAQQLAQLLSKSL
jgi:DNA-binding MarR family transcriptional regulator